MQVTEKRLELPHTGAVHIWKVPLDVPLSPGLSDLLSDGERDRAARFHFERDRIAYARSHAALRAILGSYLGTPGRNLRFALGEFGKPALDAPPANRLEFNLSHSGRWALVAVSRAPVGVDVEEWDERVEFTELAGHFFSPREREMLSGLDTPTVMQAFFRIWSRKEAYLKARGCGITNGLHHFDVTCGNDAGLVADRLEPDAPARWSMHSVEVAAGYSGAVVIEGKLSELNLFEFDA